MKMPCLRLIIRKSGMIISAIFCFLNHASLRPELVFCHFFWVRFFAELHSVRLKERKIYDRYIRKKFCFLTGIRRQTDSAAGAWASSGRLKRKTGLSENEREDMKRDLENNYMLYEILKNAQMGIWVIEIEDEKNPRMYGDREMLRLLGIKEEISAEECYQIWHSNIEPSYVQAVDETVQKIIHREKAEVEYPWKHPQHGWIYIRCGGVLDTSCEHGIRMSGYHQDVTERVLVYREKEWLEQLYEDITHSIGKLYDGILRLNLKEESILVIKAFAFAELIGKKLPYREYLDKLRPWLGEEEYLLFEQEVSLEHIQKMQEKNIDRFSGECRKMTEDGGCRWYSYTIFFDEDSRKNDDVIMAIQDISSQKRKEIKTHETISALRYHAQRDPLTSIYNRLAAQEMIEDYIEGMPEREWVALLILDIDNFKAVNDRLGHIKGDQVLIETADTIRKNFRETDIVGRLGGDEFIIFMRDVKAEENVERSMKKLLSKMERVICGEKDSVSISASIGAALVRGNGMDYQTLYRHADKALYDVKNREKNGYAFYRQDSAENQEEKKETL